jgi:hypothetical protein
VRALLRLQRSCLLAWQGSAMMLLLPHYWQRQLTSLCGKDEWSTRQTSGQRWRCPSSYPCFSTIARIAVLMCRMLLQVLLQQ